MASVRKKSRTPQASAPLRVARSEPWVLRALDAVFRFLASLKLAVVLIATLAGVLAAGTFYESYRGTQAVQFDIYQSKGFALLLAMLGVNILCAALIRFPWKKRQTGFVITHLGLLILLAGSYLSIKMADEGRVALVEGETKSKYVRIDHPVLRIQRLDSQTGTPSYSDVLSFRPGAQAWNTKELERLSSDRGYVYSRIAMKVALGTLAISLFGVVVFLGWKARQWVAQPLGAIVQALVFASSLGVAAAAWWIPIGARSDLLTEPGAPIRVTLKDYLPSATPPLPQHEPAANGVPMVRAALLVQPPGTQDVTDALNGAGWLVAKEKTGRDEISLLAANLSFQHLFGPNATAALDDFLHPPPNPLVDRVARIHYRDKSGAARVFEWVVRDEESAEIKEGEEPKPGKTLVLPESDIEVSFIAALPLPTGDRGQVETVVFAIRRGDGPGARYIGWSGLPMAPNLFAQGADASAALVYIGYFHPPAISGRNQPMMGQRGQIEVVMTDDHSFYYRAFGSEGLRGSGAIRIGETVPIFGGKNMPMQVSLRLDELIPSGRVRMECQPLDLPPSRQEEMMPAALVSMEVDGTTREVWVPRTPDLDPDYHTVDFPSGPWRVSFDFDDQSLPFQVTLLDFDPSNDPGTMSRSAFRSDVTVRGLDAAAPASLPFAELAAGEYFHFLDRPRQTFRKISASEYETFDRDEVRKADDPAAVVQPTPNPVKITMNNPMVRDNWTFYQSSFQPRKLGSGELRGDFISFLTARHDPAWPVVYGGCLLVVLGTFVQFYMRAGVFSDGGKKERERRELRDRKSSEAGRPNTREEEDIELEI